MLILTTLNLSKLMTSSENNQTKIEKARKYVRYFGNVTMELNAIRAIKHQMYTGDVHVRENGLCFVSRSRQCINGKRSLMGGC